MTIKSDDLTEDKALNGSLLITLMIIESSSGTPFSNAGYVLSV